jgi:tRNA threonylcarbamoyl adenosine modification protein (Sua5/YciO/YrdC/YwlC family)
MAQLLTVHATHPEPRLVRRAAAILADGGVVAYPTDSSYAVGCRIGAVEGLRRIRTLRGIDERHHLALLCRDLADVGRYAHLDNRQFRTIRAARPGPFTFILKATRDVPRAFKHARRGTIGVRIPSHPFVRALLAALGEPLASSTLIPAGETEALADATTVRARCEHDVDAVVDAGGTSSALTTIVDLTRDPPAVLRDGAGDPRTLGLVAAAPGEVG